MPTTAPSPAQSAIIDVPILHNGNWEHPSTPRHGDVFNPSTGATIARVPFCTAEQVAKVIDTAHAAFPAWADTPAVDRAKILFKSRELLMKNFDRLAQTVSREHGKTPAEARASVLRGVEVVEFACGAPSLLMGQTLPDLARSVDGETPRLPLGVCAGITPFNFPAMVPMWMFPIAIVCGNTFVLKPSEKVPL